MLVTTDRLSAFDRRIAAIPFKGQVLNETSAWWMRNTGHIVPNALLATPDALAAYAADEEGTAEGEHAAPGAATWATPDGKRIGASRR